MGGARLLCPRPQSPRLRPASGRGGRSSRPASASFARCPGSAPTPPPRSRRSPLAKAAPVIDTNVERVVARLAGIARPIAEARAEIRAPRRDDGPRRPPGRFRAGDDGPWRDDLPAAEPRLRPSARSPPTASPSPADARSLPGRQVRSAIVRTATGSPGGSNATARSGWCGGPARGMLGGMAALPGPEWSAEPVPPRAPLARIAPGFTHFTLESFARRSARRPPPSRATATAGGIRSTASPRPACPLCTRAPVDAVLAREMRRCRLSPSLPVPASTAPIRSAPSPRRWPALAASPDARALRLGRWRPRARRRRGVWNGRR